MIPELLLHPSDRPLLAVAFQGARQVLEISVNDVPVYRDRTGAAMTFAMPLNEWLFRGRNEIRFMTSAAHDGAGDAVLELQYRRSGQSLRKIVPLATMGLTPAATVMGIDSWNASESAEPSLARVQEPTEFSLVRQAARLQTDGTRTEAIAFSLPAPWPTCPWQNARALDPSSLNWFTHKVVREFWDAFLDRDRRAVTSHITRRARAIESAYYLNEEETEDALLFPKLLRIAEWRAAPLPEEGLRAEVHGGDRLVHLVDQSSGESPFRLINETAGVEALIDGWWAFSEHWDLLR